MIGVVPKHLYRMSGRRGDLSFKHVVAFLEKHERPLGALLFAFGFLTDLFTFGTLPPETINWFFIVYLTLALLSMLATQYMRFHTSRKHWWEKSLAVFPPLLVQYAFGGLFSGFVVFYARSSVLGVSWPFLLLLLLMYAGNEYFRKERAHFLFQTLLFFVALYAYTIFALPFYTHHIGVLYFFLSTLCALLGFALVVYLLYLIERSNVLENLKLLGVSAGTVTGVICLSYVFGLIPPLPLALSDIGVYHAVEKQTDGTYTVTVEEKDPWWHIGAREVTIREGEPLSVFSSVHAPIAFSNSVSHVWEHYDERTRSWRRAGTVTFPMSGGRARGYRGFSTKEQVPEGKWRVTVETLSGQAIGRIRFDVTVTDAIRERGEETH